MRRFALCAAAVVGLAFTAPTASAQFNRNVIRDSGNGANNTIIATNGPIKLHAPAGAAYAPQAAYAPVAPDFGGYPQAGYAPVGASYGGFQQAGYAPTYAPSYAPAPLFGGFNRHSITNSGNGVGNTIVARNGGFGGFGFNGSYPGGGIFPGGVNVNVVTNSANGVGNSILAGNGRPGGLNLNIITNSGNGVGNRIITRNR